MGRSLSPAARRRDARSRSAPRRGRSRGRSPSRSRSRSNVRRVASRSARSSPPRRERRTPPRRRSRSYSSSSSSSRSRSRSRSRSAGRRGNNGSSARRGDDHRRRRSVSSESRSRSRSSSASSRSRSRSRSASSTRGKRAAPAQRSNGQKSSAQDTKADVKREPKRERSVTPPRRDARDTKRDVKRERSATPPRRDTERDVKQEPKRDRSVSPPRRDARDAKRETKREHSATPPRRNERNERAAPPPAAGAQDASATRKRERSPSADVKRESDRVSKASKRSTDTSDAKPPRDQRDAPQTAAERTRDDTKRVASPELKRESRRSPSQEKTPPRAAATTQSPSRTANSDSEQKESATPPRTAVRNAPDATPPRRATQDKRTRSASGDQTPPRKSQTTSKSTRARRSASSSSSRDRTPPRKTRRKRSDRDRKRRGRSSSRSSSSSSESSSSESDRTPPRRSRKKTNDKRSDRTPPKSRHSTNDTKASAFAKPDTSAAAATDAIAHVNLFANDAKSGRTGGVYIPPFKLAQLRASSNLDKSSPEYQRQTWDALRKSLNGVINKVNVSNIGNILPELFQENLVRARGLLARSIMKAQLASPGFTHIYAALVAVINTKMPENGELVVKRVVHRFRRAFQRGDKVVAIALVRFIAHLVNQQVVHELLALEVLTLLLANPTDDSVEVAVNFTKECGQLLAELCPEGLRAIFERFRGILHEGEIDKRVQYTIEGLFAIRKGGFADYPAVHPELDLVESGDQITHETTLEEAIDREDKLDVFRVDPDYEKNEAMWTAIKKEILGESDSDDDGSDGDASGSSGSESDDDDENNAQSQQQQLASGDAIQDLTEQDLVNLRRTIYLTIMSSISHEECAHKLMKLNIRPGQEKEICSMLLECCSQERTYLRYYGLLGQRFCLIKREYQDAFDACFAEQYALIHRLETNKLRNVAKFFAHLLLTDALPWTVFEYIRLTEDETTSSSRIFIKILCQELSEHMGLTKLKDRFLDALMQQTFAGLFPKDNPRNTRFAINFFTSIGLGGLTTDLREHLKNAPTLIMAQSKAAASSDSSSSDSDSSSSGSSSGSSSSGSSSSGSSSDSSSDSSDSD